MILFPAIDLKDGACVRLVRGEMNQSTTFNDDPAAQARDFADAGFEWIHIVDLNGAFAGKPVNAEAVAAIVGAVDLPVQLGGGIRSMDTIARWLEAGVQRVILGTAALKDPDLVRLREDMPELEELFGEGTTERLRTALIEMEDPQLLAACQRPEGMIAASNEDYAAIAEVLSEMDFIR